MKNKLFKKIIFLTLILIVGVLLLFLALKNKNYEVILSNNQQIYFDKQIWAKLGDSQENAINFERKETFKNDVFNQVITIYDQSLLESRKNSFRSLSIIDSNAYLVDFFRVHTEGITTRIVYDYGSYYVMSRQTYKDNTNLNPEGSEENMGILLDMHLGNIQHTVYILKNITNVSRNYE